MERDVRPSVPTILRDARVSEVSGNELVAKEERGVIAVATMDATTPRREEGAKRGWRGVLRVALGMTMMKKVTADRNIISVE